MDLAAAVAVAVVALVAVNVEHALIVLVMAVV
jgi:hypothetical protein